MMFDMSTTNTKTNEKSKSKNLPTTPNVGAGNGVYVTDTGVTKDAWFREEEMMRKKLEKTAITQLKNRIAQANR